MKYKCEFELKLDPFVNKCKLVLYYKPEGIFKLTREVFIRGVYFSSFCDNKMDGFLDWLSNISQEELIEMAKKEILQNEKNKTKKDSNFDKYCKLKKKVNKLKFEIDV